MTTSYNNTIISFIKEIGIPLEIGTLPEDNFILGIKIDKGTLYYNPSQLKYYRDLLHEAGHMALMTPEERSKVSGNVMEFRSPEQDDEIAVMLWTVAACNHLRIPLEIVFHEEGYKGESEWLIEQFLSKNYIGLPLLEWKGLCNAKDFPKMNAWLVEDIKDN